MYIKTVFNSVTLLKGIACIMVFMSHWYDAFFSWGVYEIDCMITKLPFSLIYNGNLAVCIFMVLSGFLFAIKNQGRDIHASWTDMVLKRYFRLTVPIVILSVLALMFSKMGLFYNIPASQILKNEWLSWYYDTELSWKALLSSSLIRTLTVGDSLFYGPLWMMKYMFLGSFFCIIVCRVLSELTAKGKSVFLSCILVGLFVLNSYYICFLLGIVLACINMEKIKCDFVAVAGCILSGMFCVKCGSVLPLYFRDCGLPTALSSYSFYNMLGAFFFVFGINILIEKHLQGEHLLLVFKPFLWFGKRSFSVFFMHWIIICSFSCWFYMRAHSLGNFWAIGINFVLTFFIVIVASIIFYELIETRLFQFVWKQIRQALL